MEALIMKLTRFFTLFLFAGINLHAMDAPFKKQRVDIGHTENPDSWAIIDDFQEELMPLPDQATIDALGTPGQPAALYSYPALLANTGPLASTESSKKDPDSTGYTNVSIQGLQVLNKLRCPDRACTKSFDRFVFLKNHILKDHAQLMPFFCDIPDCMFKTADPSYYQKHMATKHKACPNTTVYLEMHKQISAALNPYFSDWKFKCEICDRLFHEKSSLTAHISLIHKQKEEFVPYIAPNLNFIPAAAQRYSSRPNLAEKAQGEELDPEILAAIYSPDAAKPVTYVKLQEDLMPLYPPLVTVSTTPEKTTTDVRASSIVGTHELLKKNNPKSDSVGNTSCAECSQKFAHIQSLKKHILSVHTKLRPYQCDKYGCSFKTASLDNFIKHMKNEHKSEANTKLSLETQKQISAALKPFLSSWKFQCAKCDALFPSQDSLKRHTSCVTAD
jgi:uncharacterized Zn-finger protein